MCVCVGGGGHGGDAPDRRGGLPVSAHKGTGRVCCVIPAGLTKDPLILLICGRLSVDKKMSGGRGAVVGKSNDKKVKTKEQLYILSPEEPFCLPGTCIGVLDMRNWEFLSKILSAEQCKCHSTSPFQTCR